MKNRWHSPVLRIILTDLLILNFTYIFFVFGIKKYTFSAPRGGEHYLLLLIVINLLWLFISVVITKYRMEVNRSLFIDIKKNFWAITLFSGIISGFAFLFKGFLYSRLIIYGTISVFTVGLILSHTIFFFTIRWLRKSRHKKKKVLIIGDDHTALRLSYGLLSDREMDYETLVYIESDKLESQIDSGLIVGKLTDVNTVFDKERFDELFIVVSTSSDDEIRSIVKIADYYGIRVRMVPSFYKLFERNFDINLINNIPVININDIPLDRYYNWLFKRLFDIFFSVMALILTSPLFPVIALLVKITSKGPIFYTSNRVGLGGEPFKIYKFRTMYNSSRKKETESTREKDPRVTSLGRYLRKSNLDELPQFINVLKGDMSVVGPRPHRVSLDKKLQDEVAKYMIRHYIKPGITGWAQVNGWRGPTVTEEQKTQRTRHDLWYLKNWSIALDLKIIFLTLFGSKSWENAF